MPEPFDHPWVLAQLLGGIVLVVLPNLDFAWTTLSMARAGPVSQHLARATGFVIRSVARHRAVGLAGPLALVVTAAWWVAGLWTGWSLLFTLDPESVLDATDRSEADLAEAIYYVGFSLSTLGVGDYVAGRDVWRLLTAVVAFNGLVVITLAISYVVSVFSAIVQERAFAQQIHALGRTPEDMLAWSWDGEGFSALETHLTQVPQTLLQVMQQEKAFPLVREYHSADPDTSIGASVSLLQDVLVAMHCTQAGQGRTLHPVQGTLEVVLADEPEDGRAPDIDFARLERVGIPLKTVEQRAAVLAAWRGRRCRAAAFAHARGAHPRRGRGGRHGLGDGGPSGDPPKPA